LRYHLTRYYTVITNISSPTNDSNTLTLTSSLHNSALNSGANQQSKNMEARDDLMWVRTGRRMALSQRPGKQDLIMDRAERRKTKFQNRYIK
jgi:hypothetical protein